MENLYVCIYKPILLFQFKNQNRMSWTDRHGTEHPLTVIGNNNCDARKPFLVTDNGEITDEEKLPIFGVTYGPLTHEAENMTISIGPLVCEPAADRESSIKERVEALELQMNETHEKMQEDSEKSKKGMDEINGVLAEHNNLIEALKCPTSKPNYHFIDNRCYYFEKTSKTYNDAKRNCNTKFTRGGKLFEPKSSSLNKKVNKVALGIRSANWWIGINDKRNEGSWVYDSDGTSVTFSIPWYPGEPNGGRGQNCLMYWNPSQIGQLSDLKCAKSYLSICEQVV